MNGLKLIIFVDDLIYVYFEYTLMLIDVHYFYMYNFNAVLFYKKMRNKTKNFKTG